MGNAKYRHLVLYNRFTPDLKAESKKVLKTDAKIEQHVAFRIKYFNIGNQRGQIKYGKHVTPNRFPEFSYWPHSTLFPEITKSMVPTTNVLTPSTSTSVGTKPVGTNISKYPIATAEEVSEKLWGRDNPTWPGGWRQTNHRAHGCGLSSSNGWRWYTGDQRTHQRWRTQR